MYNILKNVIERGQFDLSVVITKTNTLWVEGKITDTQRDELLTIARKCAKAENSIDVFAKLTELEERVRKLEEGNVNETETIEEYVVGKWYYRSNKVIFNGKIYECIAPEDAVCTWSPEEYPAYWSEVTE